MSLVTCRSCVFWKSFDPRAQLSGTCHRHAPMPSHLVDDTSYWPETLADDACAEGVAAASNLEQTAITLCRDCMFWFRRAGQHGLIPEHRGDLSRAWWQDAAYCARHAPMPESHVSRSHWRATHAADGCGDGKPKRPDAAGDN